MTVVCPAGIVTFVCTVAEAGSELVSATVMFDAGAGVATSVAVAGPAPSVTLDGLSDSARFVTGDPRISMSSMFQPDIGNAPVVPTWCPQRTYTVLWLSATAEMSYCTAVQAVSAMVTPETFVKTVVQVVPLFDTCTFAVT